MSTAQRRGLRDRRACRADATAPRTRGTNSASEMSAVLMTTSGGAIAATIALIAIGGSLWGTIKLTSRPYEWQVYSVESVAAARAGGRPVLIDFTASWCGNCHYLEATVLKSDRVVRAVRERKIVMIKADVSDEKSPAAPLLQQLNPADSIPLTAIYLPGASQPKTLDGIYGVDDLLREIGDGK